MAIERVLCSWCLIRSSGFGLSKPVSVAPYKPLVFLFPKTVPVVLPTASYCWYFLDVARGFFAYRALLKRL